MIARAFALILALGLPFAPSTAEAQQRGKIPHVGILCAQQCGPLARWSSWGPAAAFLEALNLEGFADGKNVILDERSAGVPFDQIPGRAADLVRRNVDVILAVGSGTAARAAKTATSRIPIVIVGVADPVGAGLVSSLARPGGNVTGLGLPFAELAAKQLELLREAIPQARRVAVISNPGNPDHPPALLLAKGAAQRLGFELQDFSIRDVRGIEPAFSAVARWGAAGALVLDDAVASTYEVRLHAIQARVPTISLYREFVAGGGLMSYGPSRSQMYQQAAVYLARILKGAKPGDLPVEEPRRYDLVINRATARALGLEIPQSLSVRADEVIE